jgi:hypothetical protein
LKTDPEVAKAALTREPGLYVVDKGALPGHLPCPECGEQIEVAGIAQGRYGPHFTPKSCLLWIVGIVLTLFILRWILVALDRSGSPAPKPTRELNEK